MSLIRRPYQIESTDALKYDYEQGHNRLMAHLATGLGKTSAVAAFLPEIFPELAEHGVLFLSHRREILYQAYRTFKRKWSPEKWIGLEMGEFHATGEEDFIFSSVDSIGRLMGNRIGKFRHRYPGIIIVDEGHHVSLDGTWDNILNFFGVGSDSSQWHTFKGGYKPLSVFLTATPQRSDGETLAPFVDKVSVSFDVNYGRENGWLVDIRSFHAKVTNREYAEFSNEQQVDYIIKTWLDYGAGLRTLAFARNVEQSILLASTLNAQGYSAGHIDANTPDELRQDLVGRFSLDYSDPSALQFLSNRLIFTEGYDNPLIQSIFDVAPTDSQALYIQKLGRGLRVDPALDLGAYKTVHERKEAIRTSRKPYLTYITAFPLQHGLDMPATIFGLPKKLDTHGRLLSEVVDVIRYEEETMPEAPVRDLSDMKNLDIKLSRQDVWSQTVYNDELKALSPLRWVMGPEFMALRLPFNPFTKKASEDQPTIIAYIKTDDEWQMHRVYEGGFNDALGRAQRARHEPMDYFIKDINKAVQRVDRWLANHNPDLYRSLQVDHSGPAGPKMVAYLKRKKVSANWDNLTAETALILKDDALIRPNLQKFGLLA